jgi:hypothetical protein
LDGAPAVECMLGPRTRRLGGQWLGVPSPAWTTWPPAVFAATEPLVPVTRPQPFQADVVLAHGQVPKGWPGPASARWTARVRWLVADRSSPRVARYEDPCTLRLGAASATGRRGSGPGSP